jgi:hypothetical protein
VPSRPRKPLLIALLAHVPMPFDLVPDFIRRQHPIQSTTATIAI